MMTEEMIEQMKPLTIEIEYASEPEKGNAGRAVAGVAVDEEAKPRSKKEQIAERRSDHGLL